MKSIYKSTTLSLLAIYTIFLTYSPRIVIADASSTRIESFESNSPSDISVLNTFIKGCAETENGIATKSRSRKPEVEPTIRIENGTLIYSRVIKHVCCRKVEIEKIVIKKTIVFNEIWTGEGCRCRCMTSIAATLDKVMPGSYTVQVFKNSYSPKATENPETSLIIQEKIEIQNR